MIQSRKAVLAIAAMCSVALLSPTAMAQQEPLGCEYDDTMGSVLCYVNTGPLTLDDIAINDGQCLLWDHRLVRASLGDALRADGSIVSEGNYTDAEVATLSAAILTVFQAKNLATDDFFRFEGYRCTIKAITIKTSQGVFQLKTQQ